jgi:beta-mannan synthase
LTSFFTQPPYKHTNPTPPPPATRAQKVSLTYHFIVEQRARSFLNTFFGFNGTGGIWRRAAMEDGGGWNEESTVEDMDLSIRAYVHGWKFR